jgi:hypothetical protein
LANSVIKASAIVRAGYEYQDLVGIEVLIRYFRDRDLYDWVKLEANDSPYGALDDVVAARADGSFEFTQVKFTVDEGTNLLEWGWLLKRKPNGTSMLAKWVKALAGVRALGKIHLAELRTNRVPSSDFAAVMNGELVDLMLLDTDLRKVIEAECGGETEARAFFETFVFKSGERNLDSLEHAVKSELVPSHLDPSGWAFFREQVRRWATRLGEPFPDGKITHQHLSQAITQRRSQPIRQDFRVPANYQEPNTVFHTAFKARVADRNTPLTILWGTPGRGKSTYLSFLTDELRRENSIVIRHHYFVSAEDNSDRMSFHEISNSLISQLLDWCPEALVDSAFEASELRKNVETVARYLADRDEHLYVIVDGLDHVWRDTGRVDQLNYLFNKLLPVPNNVSLVVGTQRVDASHLPSRLVSAVKAKDWIEIPAMDQVAVHRWIHEQDKAGRPLIIGGRRGPFRQEHIDKLSAAFFHVSRGHPLHLIYVFESLIQLGHPISAEDVERVPSCPDGDIRTYYAALWNNLSSDARRLLHMLAGTDFYWPSLGIRQCVGSFDDVAFLLEHREAGIFPFHGSIFAYVREREDHAEAFQALLPRVIQWLENEAPPFWRWGWLWLCRARLGDYADLMTGVTREWAVDSLAEGWPQHQMLKVFEAAEAHSFFEGDLPRTLELRSIKTRLMNAREFQIQNYAHFAEASIATANNVQQLRNLSGEILGLSDDEVLILVKAAPDTLREEMAIACIKEYDRRINVWIELRHRPQSEFIKLAYFLLDAAALTKKPNVKNIMRFLRGFKKPRSYILHFSGRLGEAGNVNALLELRQCLRGATWVFERDRIDDDVLRACCLIGADPFTRLGTVDEPMSPLRASWIGVHKPGRPVTLRLRPAPKNLVREHYDYGVDSGLREFFRDEFFSALSIALMAEGDYELLDPGLAQEGLGWIGTAISALRMTAREIAARTWRVAFATPFLGAMELNNVTFGRGATHSDVALYRTFAAALRVIALDLHFIGLAPGSSAAIEMSEIEIARGSSHWNDDAWLDRALDFQKPILTKDAASALLQDKVERLNETITEFNERAGQWTLLARFGLRHKLGGAPALVRRAADCLLGYGWHKDVWIFDVLDAIRETHDPIASPALNWIQTLVPVIDKITEFTDGDETRHARSEVINVVARTYPDRLPLLFNTHIDRDEWYLADECLKEFVGVADLSAPEAAALISTFLDSQTLGALEGVAETSETAASLLDRQLRFLGGRPTDHDHSYSTPDNPMPSKKRPKNPTKRGPHQFAKIAGDVRKAALSGGDGSSYAATWLNHWKEQGKGKEALDNIREYFAGGESTLGVESVPDLAFKTSLAIEGPDEAYWFIVAAHIHRHGWQSYWTSSDEVMSRLQWVSDYYPDRWMSFIHDTSEPESFYRGRGYGFSIGHKYLVRFLLLVGQRQIAVKIVDMFVRIVLDEVHDQPILGASWFR